MPAPGLRLTLLTGRRQLSPLDPALVARLTSVSVTESDEQQSVFTLVFDAGRSRRDLIDVAGLGEMPIEPFSRVALVLDFGSQPVVLISGIVTQIELEPGSGPGTSSLRVSGEDLAFLLDRLEYHASYSQQDDEQIVRAILGPWQSEGLLSDVHSPRGSQAPAATQRTPTLAGSDLAALRTLARRNNFVAYVTPNPGPHTSTVYWGPPVREGPSQPPLSIDLGPQSTLAGLSLRAEAFAPITVAGVVFDRASCGPSHVNVTSGSRAVLAARPFMTALAGGLATRLPADPVSDGVAATARAQQQVDRASDGVTASGTVDGARYGGVLRPHAIVGIRGAGWSHDGPWYVARVEHSLARGHYQQSVSMHRDGYGAPSPRVASGGPV